MSALGEKCVIMASCHQMDTDIDKLTICNDQFSNIKLQVLDELPFYGFRESDVSEGELLRRKLEEEIEQQKKSESDIEETEKQRTSEPEIEECEYRILSETEDRPSEKDILKSHKVKTVNDKKESSKKKRKQKKRDTKSKHHHWWIGMSTDVLREDFVLAYKNQQNFQLEEWFPFRGPKRLPTKMETLKLFLFFKDEIGKKNGHIKSSEISKDVTKVIAKYWNMAGFMMKTKVERDVLNIVKRYNNLMKSRSKTSEKANSDRSNFKGDFAKLFDVADPQLEHSLSADRIRNHLNVKHEDLEFLEDQRGARVGWMDKEDEEFGARVKKCLKRKQSSSTASCSSTSQFQLVQDNRSAQDDNDCPLVEEEDSDDSDYNANIKKSKKSETILVEIPRKILTPSLSQTLDRSKTSDQAAMRVLSSTLKSFKTVDGKNLDLNEITISRNSINRTRNIHREEISNAAKDQFKKNKPPLAALHWDGKLMKDIMNEEHETLAILISGSPDYKEGKIIGNYWFYKFKLF